MRMSGKIARQIKVLDLSATGCSVEPAAFVSAGQIAWLRLPGLESWEATIAWVREGRAGLEFKKALHPAVVASLIERQEARRSATVITPQKIDPPINIRSRLRSKICGST
jgi:hypothetical protein